MSNDSLRDHLARLLTGKDAHATFEDAVRDLDPALRGRVPEGATHSAWQLVEHLRIAQYDILEFCRNPGYQELKWPDDYWPGSAEPRGGAAWEESIASYLADRAELVRLAWNPGLDLFATIPHGDGQTYLRELLLVADHTAYHVGQLILVRRLLGAWPPA